MNDELMATYLFEKYKDKELRSSEGFRFRVYKKHNYTNEKVVNKVYNKIVNYQIKKYNNVYNNQYIDLK